MSIEHAARGHSELAALGQRALRALRPTEMVFLAYVAWTLVRMAITGHFRVRLGFLPGPDLLVVMLAIVTVRLVVEHRAAPLEPRVARWHRLLFVPLGALSFFGFALGVGLEAPSEYGDPAQSSTWLLFARESVARVGLAVLLPTVGWLVIGRSLLRHGALARGLHPLSIARESLATLGAAARDWLALVLTIYAYLSTESGTALFGDADARLAAIDRALFAGHDPLSLLESIVSAPLSEWMAACYVSYVFLFPIALGVVYAKTPERFRWFSFAVALTLALGYVGYAFVPAQGPLFVRHFDVSLDLYYLKPIKEQLMDRPRVPRDCFPSLHTAASLTLWRGALRCSRWLGLALAPIVLTIPVACVYLRYHYVTDVLAGIVLFAVVARITDRLAVRSRRASASVFGE